MKTKIKYSLIVVVVLAVYSILSWSVLIFATSSQNTILSYGLPMLFGTASALTFLYVFSHDKSIKIARYIEEKEEKVERAWLKRFAGTGKLVTSFIIGIFGGPILAALTIRLLLPKYKYRYLLIIVINIISTIYFVGALKGAVRLFF